MSSRAKNKFLESGSKNALKCGVYSHVEVLPFEDPKLYRRHVRAYLDEYEPVGIPETDLVREIAYVIWCMRRLKLAKRGLFSQRMGVQSKDAIDIELMAGSSEAVVSEHQKVVRAQQAADEIVTLYLDGRNASIKQIMQPATPDMKNQWKSYRRGLGKTASLSDELINFLNLVYLPTIRKRLLDLTSTEPMRQLAYGIALAPEHGTAIERAESHLDHRLKKLLTLLFGLQDRREKKAATNSSPSEHSGGPSYDASGNVTASLAAATIESPAIEPR